MRRARRGRAPLVGVAVAVLVVVGCSTESRLDADRAEAAVRDQIGEAFATEVTAVRCPDDIAIRQGLAVTCEADLSAGTMTVQLLQTDDDGAVRVLPEQALVVTEAVEEQAAAALAVRYQRDDVTVTCAGPAERLVEPEATIACEADDGEDTVDLTVRVRDVWGALAFTLRD